VITTGAQKSILSAVEGQDIRLFSAAGQSSSTSTIRATIVPISDLPVDVRDKVTALFNVNDLTRDFQVKVYADYNGLVHAIYDRFSKHMEDSLQKADPRYTFDVSTGKLKLPISCRLGDLEIRFGELDTYAVVKAIALALFTCGAFDTLRPDSCTEFLRDYVHIKAAETK
jgi:hypothetical protein